VLSYDAVRVIADSLQRAGKAEPGALRDAIAGTNLDSLMASNGPISFTDTGENKNATPLLMQVNNGQTQQVFPQASAATAPVYPAPPTR
jgi:branched-chain amino acid transport system substrate-binding protein